MSERPIAKGDITLEDEAGAILDGARVDLSAFLRTIYDLVPEEKLRETHCLQFIAAWDDTTFNTLQMAVLHNELVELVAHHGTPATIKEINPVVDLLAKYQNESHLYIKFFGD
ncbi:MAG: hypothetical protein ABL984_08170 [Pyrinomonadaceae bacterium]